MSSVSYSEIPMLSAVDRMDSIDTDFEDDSDVEDLSPRISLGSTKRKSDTTISSLHEPQTPNLDSNGLCKFKFDITKSKPVEGPRGPHLFRSSISIATEPDIIENYYLNIISTTPTIDYSNYHKPIKETSSQLQMHHSSDLSVSPIDNINLVNIFWWTPQQVARWMYHVGLDLLIAEKFEKNDISGAILLTLKFEDLAELDIPSLGLRTKIWNEVNHLRCSSSRPVEDLNTLNESVKLMDKKLLTPSRKIECHETKGNCKQYLITNKRNTKNPDIISSSISRSSPDIENLIVKENKNIGRDYDSNSKGQQILADDYYRKSNPQSLGNSFSSKKNAMKRIFTFPDALEVLSSVNELFTIYDSEVRKVESKKTSSQLEEANLRLIDIRDPQENVKQFIDSQAVSLHTNKSYCQETTKQELKTQILKIEGSNTCIAKSQILDCISSPSITFSPHQMERVVAISPELQNIVQPPLASNCLRAYSPKTDISLSIMHPELEAVARKVCHSVLKNFIKLSPHISHIQYSSPMKALPPVSEEKFDGLAKITSGHVTQVGWMRKRKTKILRFDWQNYYFSLKGTQLAMHKHECLLDVIDYIDIDDYAIVCSSFATSSRLHAAFKAMSLSRKKDKDSDKESFTFQLVPASVKKSSRHHKFRRIKAHHFAVHSQNERSDWMREMMLAKAMHKKSQGYKINVNGNVT
ncbi:hypothetical protein EPUL_000802 [Erysiphe pulchra]|uniref:SAM domain-containing protein n=1 Tax=Erysiphe pulchra TaxID=225359 RepID=A0A2S4Q1N9_9PEZI|nr:hypothetical protein EPUL_000802 [Erysiphe pulchra]